MDALLLSIKPRRICEMREGKQIVGPLSVFKLESGRSTMVNTGIKIAKCPKGSLVKVSPYDDYADKLRFIIDTFESTYSDEILLQVVNVSDQFIRLDPKYHPMLSIELITEDAQIDEAVADVLDDIVEHVVEEETKEEPEEETKEETKEEPKKPKIARRTTKRKINVKV